MRGEAIEATAFAEIHHIDRRKHKSVDCMCHSRMKLVENPTAIRQSKVERIENKNNKTAVERPQWRKKKPPIFAH